MFNENALTLIKDVDDAFQAFEMIKHPKQSLNKIIKITETETAVLYEHIKANDYNENDVNTFKLNHYNLKRYKKYKKCLENRLRFVDN